MFNYRKLRAAEQDAKYWMNRATDAQDGRYALQEILNRVVVELVPEKEYVGLLHLSWAVIVETYLDRLRNEKRAAIEYAELSRKVESILIDLHNREKHPSK
jgi:hypothetical protein